MTYTIKLLKEALVSIESNLLTKYFLIVFLIFTFFFVINIVQAYIKEKKLNSDNNKVKTDAI